MNNFIPLAQAWNGNSSPYFDLSLSQNMLPTEWWLRNSIVKKEASPLMATETPSDIEPTDDEEETKAEAMSLPPPIPPVNRVRRSPLVSQHSTTLPLHSTEKQVTINIVVVLLLAMVVVLVLLLFKACRQTTKLRRKCDRLWLQQTIQDAILKHGH